MMVLEIMTVLMMVLGKASTELGINTNALACCDCDNFYTFWPYYKYQDPHQNFQTAVHRIRPRAYMVLAEAWAARFWPIALILCNIQCIVPR